MHSLQQERVVPEGGGGLTHAQPGTSQFTFPDGSVLSSNISEGSSQPLAAKMLLFNHVKPLCLDGLFFLCLLRLIIDDEVGKQQEV